MNSTLDKVTMWKFGNVLDSQHISESRIKYRSDFKVANYITQRKTSCSKFKKNLNIGNLGRGSFGHHIVSCIPAISIKCVNFEWIIFFRCYLLKRSDVFFEKIHICLPLSGWDDLIGVSTLRPWALEWARQGGPGSIQSRQSFYPQFSSSAPCPSWDPFSLLHLLLQVQFQAR